ncbi:MAG TPA: hypothetical protein VLJ41_06135 [Segetibacter sp.]|nr:hypothetical protein [Segetibacter sp.]
MEPEMVAFLKRIGKSLTIVFCWLAITATAAIKGDNAFIGAHLSIGNILFYLWLVISAALLAIIFKKLWFSKE